SLDFGSVALGTTVHKSFVVKNAGNVPLTVNTIGLDTGTTSEFSAQAMQTLPAVLAQGQQLQVDVAYAGTSAGRHMGRIRVATDAFDDPMTLTDESVGYVAVQAISLGPNIIAIPTSIDFGNVALHTN